MATEKTLDKVILGLLGHEELTGYEIKKRMDTTLSHFWGASYGSIYPTLSQLVDAGLAAKREDGSARGRVIYSITPAGRECLAQWLDTPARRDEIRYETLLKVFFGGGGSRDQILARVDDFERGVRASLSALEQSMERLRSVSAEDEAHRYYLLTAEFGMKTYAAQLEWCAQARAALKGE